MEQSTFIQQASTGKGKATTQTLCLTGASYYSLYVNIYCLSFLAFFIVLPLVSILLQPFKRIRCLLSAITHPDALAAIKLTLIVVAITVPLNAIFGIMVRLGTYKV